MHLFNAFKFIKRHDGIWHIQKIFLPVNQNVGFSQLLILIKFKSARDSQLSDRRTAELHALREVVNYHTST